MTINTNIDIISTLEKMGLSDKDTITLLVNKFVEQCPNIVDAIKKTFREEDYEQFSREAHTLKGMCLNMGVTGLGDLATDLNKAGLEENIEAIKELMPNLDQTFTETESKLKDFLEKL